MMENYTNFIFAQIQSRLVANISEQIHFNRTEQQQQLLRIPTGRSNQFAIYKCSCEVEPGTTRIKFNVGSERVLNLESLDLNASAL